MRKKKRITAWFTFLAMLLTCCISNTSLKVHAATNTTKGETTKIYAGAFAQNTDDWNWMSIGDSIGLVYQDVTNLNAKNTNDVLGKSNSTANFGINISDGNLADGDSSSLKFHIGTVTVKADGYDDLVINLNKDYSENYTATAVSWGIDGNSTKVLLNDYLPKDSAEKAKYLTKITNVSANITLSEYSYSKKATTPKTGNKIYTQKGESTKVYTGAFAQNTDDWAWMNLGDSKGLLYQDTLNYSGTNSNDALAKANSTANFGINISDGNLAAGDSSELKFHIGTVTVKADGYDDLVINLNKDYSENYEATAVSWGLTGNTTQVLLNDYLPKDATEKVNYLKKITSLTADITLSDYTYIKAVPAEPEFPADYKHPTEMRDISAMDLVKDMKVGWNLGNTLESTGGETGWGNPKTTRKMIDEIKNAGFNTLRIPVRWDEHYTDDNYTIDPEYMSRVETVVNYALANNMYAILNIHHNAIQGEMNNANKDKVIKEGTTIWNQIAEHFKDYSDKLIFETINEPRVGDDWTGTTESYNVINDYNASILPVIRATGGNNEKRLVMIPGYAASSDYAKVSAMKVPQDSHVAVSIHAYIPYNFAMNTAAGSQTTFGDTDKAFIDKTFRLLDKTFKQKGIPVVLGEFAATDKNNLQDRTNFAKYYLQVASSYQIPCCWWDNNAFAANTTDSMGLFNRKTLKFVYPEIVQAMLDGWNNPKDNSNYDPSVLFNGAATSKGWGQALSLSYGLDFTDADFSNKLAIAVDYTSEKSPQLILSGNLTGTNWVTLNPAVTKSKGTTNTAYFTLKDMVTAYKNALKDYDSYGTVLPGIQTIYIGDQGADLSVAKVSKIFVGDLEKKVNDSTINEANKTLYTDVASKNSLALSVKLSEELQKVVDTGLTTVVTSYKSSDEKVAKVSQDGKVTATGVGNATITTIVTVGESTKSFTTNLTVKSSGIPLLGDVDGNGMIDTHDYELMSKYLVNDTIAINKTNADLNGDGIINLKDLILLKKAM
ncbi:cellulase family glycosylhydrolase [Clostridium sp. SHJSY1]|uniref:cellulase family glycosylhydrolase n=1 Tax=Clostridium sp. SHJSY1 TaxID=2942483 RepID=UPI002875E53B|nr:cellulase family glycosylhydrolase [Clostridium sp. SHJSY1]MDS0525280.1 cellulase family glycosylhydrolase [Clostridium sp. SHJSY1]